MFEIVRFSKNLESLFDSLQFQFHWDHFEYFCILVLLIVIAWKRRHIALFNEDFIQILKAGGIQTVKSMPLAPNFNPFVERFIRSIKSECLDRMIILGEAHLRYCIQEYISHYHTERAHQGLDNMLIEPPPQGTGKIIRQERLGGLLNFYRRAA